MPNTPSSPRRYRIRVRGDWSRASFTRARGLQLERVDTGVEPTRRPVTLKPPYSLWKGMDTDNSRITLQQAVTAVGQQVGIDYDWDTSYKNTNPVCRSWIYPVIEDMPFDDAMEKILLPRGLTYKIEDNRIVLMRKGKRR